jgi:HEAT repeat protein
MATIQQGSSVVDVLWAGPASGDPQNHVQVFGATRGMFPYEVTAACLYYLAHEGLNPAGESMAFWLSLNTRYLKVLFNPSALPIEVAENALAALRKSDAQIIPRFLEAAEQISNSGQILHVMRLVPILGDYAPLLPWLRTLSQQADERVKSCAIKLLCEVRPHKVLIGRQMHDANPRVRANVVEALWNWDDGAAAEVFEAATADVHHRVVANALVGLYLNGDPTALRRMIKLCQSPDAGFRAAMAWSLGAIGDKRGAPVLQCLSKDRSGMVRKRALRSLLALEPEEE